MRVVVVVDCDVGGCTGVVTVVWRVVVVVASGSLAQDTSIKRTTESAEPSMITLFISMYCFFNKQSSQIASPDVLKRRILFKSRSSRAASLALHVSVSIQEFSF